jgi:uncharacterized protein YbjT (DUF2867 family)
MRNSIESPKILVAGATGYLGKHIVDELKDKGFHFKAIARNPEKLKHLYKDQIVKAEVTQYQTLKGIFDGVDTVISTVGITRQKDGLTYMDVDYQANMNLLKAALRSDVKKFIYISAINGDQLRNLKIFEAKEAFVDALKNSGLDYTIVRPNGFFSDMGDFLQMAKGGRVYLFGHGNYKLNPIHGADLAEYIVKSLNSGEKELIVGGPDVFTQNQLAELALDCCKKAPRITHLPDWIRNFTISILRTFTSSKTYGPYEFFLTAMARDNVAPVYGKYHLRDYFKQEVEKLNI